MFLVLYVSFVNLLVLFHLTDSIFTRKQKKTKKQKNKKTKNKLTTKSYVTALHDKAEHGNNVLRCVSNADFVVLSTLTQKLQKNNFFFFDSHVSQCSLVFWNKKKMVNCPQKCAKYCNFHHWYLFFIFFIAKKHGESHVKIITCVWTAVWTNLFFNIVVHLFYNIINDFSKRCNYPMKFLFSTKHNYMHVPTWVDMTQHITQK